MAVDYDKKLKSCDLSGKRLYNSDRKRTMVKLIKATFFSVIKVFSQLKWFVKIMVVLVVVVPPFMAVSIVATGTPGFCNSCHIMNSYHDNWQRSSHKDVNCMNCHVQPGLLGYAKAKINGLAQAVNCAVGRIATKPNALVVDASCLRPECHSTDQLKNSEIIYKDNIKFSHKNHIQKTFDGINISCSTCHSHFEGDEHFSVNSEACFSCHFLDDKNTDTRLVRTTCLDCHEVPDNVIKRGLVTVDHSEFVSYQASCDDSCHKKQIDKPATVAETVCLNCHSFNKKHEPDMTELHSIHTSGEKVECFSCHGDVKHGPAEDASVASMMDCKNCHSDTHNVQQTFYSANGDYEHTQSERVLSPMYLTHVECQGCHIDQGTFSSGALDSIGTVAKAVPQACDKCHRPGTGEKYIPFWQGNIKERYEQVRSRLSVLQKKSLLETDKVTAKKLQERVVEAQMLLKSVESDGSWGVHNFKYIEAMLRKADEIIAKSR